MSEEDVNEQFKQFLEKNKIDFSSLKNTKDKDSLFNVKDQRIMSIIKAVRYIKCLDNIYRDLILTLTIAQIIIGKRLIFQNSQLNKFKKIALMYA